MHVFRCPGAFALLPSGTPAPCTTGTPQYIAKIDKAARALVSTNFLGCGGRLDTHPEGLPDPDPHNVPAITIDSRKFLHVVPFRAGYTVYHHKLDVDRFGRLYLSYATWEQQLSPAVAAAYCTRWPDECDEGDTTPDPDLDQTADCTTSTCWYQDSAQPHDPVRLISTDGGGTWRLATSQDLYGGIVR